VVSANKSSRKDMHCQQEETGVRGKRRLAGDIQLPATTAGTVGRADVGRRETAAQETQDREQPARINRSRD